MDRIDEFAPRFEHTCPTCVFLGQYDTYDMWFHPEPSMTFIIRFGAGEQDYVSSLSLWNRYAEFYEAAQRAVKIGLVTEEVLKYRYYLDLLNLAEDSLYGSYNEEKFSKGSEGAEEV